MLPTIPNLRANAVTIAEPWRSTLRRPAFAAKDDFRAWCNAPDTAHLFYSGFTGRHAGIRISEINPAQLMHALVVDYDADPLADPVAAVNNRGARFRPTWLSTTFSGHLRAVWVFERPIPVFTDGIARGLFRKLVSHTHYPTLFPGCDHGATENPSQYFELGTEWRRTGQAPIPYHLLLAWVEDLAEKHRWNREGVAIPIEALRELGERMYPDRWPGGWDRFAIGARGPRFWDPSASNATAGIVRETGVTYFTDGGGFRTWADIFGEEAVREFQDNRMGSAVADIFHLDGKYWSKNPSGFWAPDTPLEVRQTLIVAKGLSAEAPADGGVAEVDRALVFIREHQRVQAAVPFLYRPDGLVEFNGKRFLNISTLRPLPPASFLPDTPDMGFPWISQYLGSAFASPDDFWSFLAWLQHFYRGAVTQSLSRGLALFLAGPADAGKTRLNKAVIGRLMGRSEDAARYLQGEDRFNDELFGAPLWTLDDPIPPGDQNARKRFGQFLKQVVANDKLQCRAMHRSGADAPWVGRVVITLNDDPESTQIIPDLEENTRDKLLLLRMVAPTFPEGMRRNPSDPEILAELPYFARWLMDIVIPPGYVREGSRFGVRAYHNPELEEVSRKLASTSTTEEVLNEWRREWFGQSSLATWEGNPSKLLADLLLMDGSGDVAKTVVRNPNHLARDLQKLIRRGCPWLSCPDGRNFVIRRP